MTNSDAARHLRNEEPFVQRLANRGLLVEDWTALYDDLVGIGCSHSEATAICGWLMLKADGRPDPTSKPARARYRRRLSELAGDAYNEPGSGRPPSLGGGWLVAHNHRPSAAAARAQRALELVHSERSEPALRSVR